MPSTFVRSLLGFPRAAVVRVHDDIDRYLHPRRRAAARARLEAAAPSTILFVCLGNICRSPYAARLLQVRTASDVRAESAGYLGPGRHPPSEAIEIARARGIEHADHVSRLATNDLLAGADAIFVFDRFNVKSLRGSGGALMQRVYWLGDFDPSWSGKRAIPDPWGKPLDTYRATFERIERCIDEVVRILR